ncbi:MAG: MBL fold metallo-hydrolase [Solirubrobacteraceae bacterium]|nr:MBL fold metallo-hydrolase [Patulibacter sp.]
MSLIIERTEAEGWTSNSYLVADGPGGKAIVIDGNGVSAPLIAKAKELGVEVEAILVTHQHADHVAGVDELRDAFAAPVYTSAVTAVAVPDLLPAENVSGGDTLTFGDLTVEAILSEGHCAGQLAFLVNGTDCFTADTIFKGTVGGNFAPSNTGYADQKAAAMRLAQLPAETVLHPGHTLPTTAGEEWEHNPFIRIWRGLDPEGTEEVTVWDRKATLILWAPDYDGTNKAWVRFHDTGEDGITGGSQVVR